MVAVLLVVLLAPPALAVAVTTLLLHTAVCSTHVGAVQTFCAVVIQGVTLHNTFAMAGCSAVHMQYPRVQHWATMRYIRCLWCWKCPTESQAAGVRLSKQGMPAKHQVKSQH